MDRNDMEQGLLQLPEYMRGGMRRYVVKGIPPGDFLMAVLSNDLFEAFGRADSTNQFHMLAYVKFLYNDTPRGCYGSPEAVSAWIDGGGLEGREAGQ